MIKTIFDTTSSKMDDAIKHLNNELASIRGGRASVALLDRVRVDYYGTMTPLSQVASLSTPDAKSIAIQPWEASIIPSIEKAIMTSELKLNPTNDGKIIRVNIPSLTEERRRELVKIIKRITEDARVQIRNCRRDGNDEIKSLKSSSDISEDDARKAQEKIQKLTDQYIGKVDELFQKKEKEMMEV